MAISASSAAAYQHLKASGVLMACRLAIVAAAAKFRKGRGFTRPELLEATGLAENQISGRCRELIDCGAFRKTGRLATNDRTGHLVEVLEMDPELREAWGKARRAGLV